MLNRSLRLAALAALALSFAVFAEPYPGKPVQVIVPFQAGGSADLLLRVAGQRLTELWGQQLVLIDRPGASGIIGTELAAKAKPDGYTLYLASDGPIAVNPSLFARLPYDWKRDFVPVSLLATLNQVLVVHPSLPAASLRELIALAKQKPGHLNYASMGDGSSQHLGAELFKSLAGVELVHVPYRGSPAAMTALLAGEVAVYFVGESTPAPYVKAGKLRPLATTGKTRSEVYPDVPAVAEVLPEYEMTIWFGIFAPAGVPGEIVAKLNADIAKAIAADDVRAALAARGFTARSSSPGEFRALVERDEARYAQLLQRAGIRPK